MEAIIRIARQPWLIAFFLLSTGHTALNAQAFELMNAARAHLQVESDTALVMLEKAIDELKAKGPADSLAEAYTLLQEYYFLAPKELHTYMDKSAAYQEIAKFFRQAPDSLRLAKLYLRWADLDQEVDYKIGQEHILEADRLFRALGDQRGLADCQFRMGVLQGSMGNTALVLQHFEEALSLAEKARDTAYMAEAHTRIAEFYMRGGQLDSADEYITRAFSLRGQARPSTMLNAYRIKGYLASYQEQYDEAFQQLGQAIKIAETEKDEVRLAMLYIDIGQIYYSFSDDLSPALEWLTKGLAAAGKARSQRFMKSAHQGLAAVYEELEDYPNALAHQKAFMGLQQQMQNYQANQQMLQLAAQYENEKKELALARQEAELARKDGQRRTLWAFLLSLAVITIAGAIAFFFQLKARRTLAQQNAVIEQQAGELKELDAAKSRFFANIAHELRTPLTLILAPIDSMLKRNQIAGQSREFLELARGNARQLLRRIGEILDLSKLESGKLELQETPVQIDSFLYRQSSLFESHAQYKGVGLSHHITLRPDTYILLDEDKLGKIINNLLSNALKFTASGGAIRIAAKEEQSQLTITVSDTGRGILPDDLPRIFDRFYQSRQADAPLEGGAGIGLALSRELAELMEGSLTAESSPGAGSSFHLTLPYRETKASEAAIAQEGEIPEPAVETETGAQEKRQASASRQSTILLVEDNPGLQDYIGMILSQHYQLVIASNGKEALDILQSEEQKNINLILSDVMMPEVDGFTLVERIKQDEKLRHLPTIMLTARAGQEDRLRALRIGVDDYILKPFEEEELLLRLENTLRNFHLRFEANTDAGLPEEKEENRQDEAWVPSPDRLSLEDQEWLAQLELATLKQVGNSSFNTDALADILAISRRQLFRKIKSLTGLTPNQYIQEVRLQRARRLLEQQAFSTVKAIAFNVGLKDVRYFSQQYRQRFGKLPSEYY